MERSEVKPTAEPSDIYDLWRAGYTHRWHSHTHPGLRRSDDQTAAHSHRMCVLIAMLGSQREDYKTTDLLEDIMATIFHDTDEMITGDMSHPAKVAMPDVAAKLAEFGQQWLLAHGVPAFKPSYFVKMCDRLDAYLHMLVVAPELQHLSYWQIQKRQICDGARTLKIGNQVIAMIAVAERRDWE